MRARLLEALARLWEAFRGLRSPVRLKTEPDERDPSRAAARGRFWTEFRAGQREAEAQSSRPR